MVNKQVFLLLFLSLNAADNPLSPGPLVQMTFNDDGVMPVIVASTSAGLMSVAVLASSLQSSFSDDDGASWVNSTPISENSFYPMWVSGNPAGFMATWIGVDIGYQTAAPLWSFSSDNGDTWTTRAAIVSGALSITVFSPIATWGTPAGFMAAWNDNADTNAYAAFTSNNGGSWSAPVNISNSGTVRSGPRLAANGAGFIATWRDTSGNAFASFTTDHGATWSTPSQIMGTGVVNTDVWVGGNASGFLATWADASGNAYAQFSSDNGTTWGAPALIAPGILVSPCPTDVTVAGTSSGFVIGAIGNDNNAYGSFSSDHGKTWSTPVQITDDGTVVVGDVGEAGNGYGYVSVAATDAGVVFAFLRGDGNTYSSFSPLASINAPANAQGTALQRSFLMQKSLVNLITWSAPVTGTAPVSYQIYRDAGLTDLIATIPAADALQYYDNNREPNTSYVYYIVSIDDSGDVSAPSVVTIAP